MPRSRFVQIHTLASYPGTLLNRDAAGEAKRLPFGGAVRARVSSQALKRRWRFAGEADHDAAKRAAHSLQNLDVAMGDRSKEVVERVVMPRATEGLGDVHAEVHQAVTEALVKELYGDKAADKKNRQALFFGHPETEYLCDLAHGLIQQAVGLTGMKRASTEPLDKSVAPALEKLVKDTVAPLRNNLRALAKTTLGAAGLESALFGRMVTSDPNANVDAPVHVAHAFSVHAIEREFDYVTAVDDLRSRGDDAQAGSAGIFDMELTSGLYYGYVNVDVELLVANLNQDADLAGKVVGRLLRLIAQTSPGAKKGSTAPYAHAEFMLVEVGNEQPRTLANAFRKPVALRGDVFESAMKAMQEHLVNLDTSYGKGTERWQLSVTPPALTDVEKLGMDRLTELVAKSIGAD